MTALQSLLEPVVAPFRDVASLAALGWFIGIVAGVFCVSFTLSMIFGKAVHYSQEPIEDTIAYAEQRRGERR